MCVGVTAIETLRLEGFKKNILTLNFRQKILVNGKTCFSQFQYGGGGFLI